MDIIQHKKMKIKGITTIIMTESPKMMMMMNVFFHLISKQRKKNDTYQIEYGWKRAKKKKLHFPVCLIIYRFDRRQSVVKFHHIVCRANMIIHYVPIHKKKKWSISVFFNGWK